MVFMVVGVMVMINLYIAVVVENFANDGEGAGRRRSTACLARMGARVVC